MRLIDADEMLKEGYTQVTKNELNKSGEWVLVARPIATFPTVAAEPTKHQDTESWRTTATEGVGEYAPIKHGRWIRCHELRHTIDGRVLDGYSECSVCGELYPLYPEYNYCPNCGARMDGGENEIN